MFTAATTLFFAATDLCVVDTDSEHADMSNPRGEIYGHAAYVVAEDELGNRRYLDMASSRWESEVLPQAEALAAALNARATLGKLPVGFGSWREDRPAYGSEAFIASGQGELDARQERLDDEERA